MRYLKKNKLKKKREEHLKEGKSFEGTWKLKVLLETVGGVDRTRLVKNLAIKNRYQANYKLTVGVDILTKDVEFRQGEFLTLSIWDIRGQQRFEFIRSTFYKGAAGAILVFDLTREETYIEIKKRFTEIRHFAGENIPFILVGDNVHLFKLRDKPTIREEAREFANNEGGIYIETSPISIDIIEGAIQKFVLNIIELRETAPRIHVIKRARHPITTSFKPPKLPDDLELTQEEKDFLKNLWDLWDGDFDFFPYPYIFKPPRPPGEAGAEAKLKPEYISSKKVSESTLYCKHCGADLSNGELICHVCGKKTV